MTSAFIAAILAVIVFMITQSILKFVIEPIQEQRKLIGEIANAFVAYADVPVYSAQELYERPEETSAYRERLAETRQELRRLSGRLRATLWAIPFYKLLSRIKAVPKVADIDEASDGLIGWSNTLASPDAHDRVRKHQDTVSEKLGITPRYEQLRATKGDSG
jgi:hypothetical protein